MHKLLIFNWEKRNEKRKTSVGKRRKIRTVRSLKRSVDFGRNLIQSKTFNYMNQ